MACVDSKAVICNTCGAIEYVPAVLYGATFGGQNADSGSNVRPAGWFRSRTHGLDYCPTCGPKQPGSVPWTDPTTAIRQSVPRA
jgi:hypothetical protein